ncbi:KRAB-A domain-containing protein 2-like [Ostrinia furnacalis]|uniref:KRAB-A domain-containing protein 2-like n=1 Tax=Ostrinia furnacalis TaxID=93504 RepID=UPI001039B2E1|nr:KRAB-A domain-containing protein 2-like [Ostrinia furnacalis]
MAESINTDDIKVAVKGGTSKCKQNMESNNCDVDREEFYRRIQEAYRSKKAPNTFLLTPEKYALVLQQVKAARISPKKTASDYRRIKRYVVVDTPLGERLFAAPKDNQPPQQMFVNTQEIYDIIRDCHLKYNHGGRNRLMTALKPIYRNITTESILVYLQMCLPCKSKLIRRGKGVRKDIEETFKPEASKIDDIFNEDDDPLETEIDMQLELEPETNQEQGIIYPELYSRGQLDILDVTTDPNEEYKYMMVYRDFVNQYIHLKPLKAISVDETVDVLLDIFLVFGAPNILQSKNGIAVITPICRRICAACPEMRTVPGNAVFSKNEFKGKSNEDILKQLNKWLEVSQSTKWHQGLKFVQHSLNTTFQSTICRTPSQLVFGTNPRMGLASCMSKNEYELILSESDLKAALDQKENNSHRSRKQLKLEESLVLPCNFIKDEAIEEEVNEEIFDES